MVKSDAWLQATRVLVELSKKSETAAAELQRLKLN